MQVDAPALGLAAVCASGSLYWLGVIGQAVRIRRHIGRSPNLKPKGTKEKLLWLGWFVVIVTWIGQPLMIMRFGDLPIFASLPLLADPWTLAPGLIMIVAAHAGTLWCYAALADSWRIGIKKKEKTELVTSGPYRWIRHPIYSFQILALLGAAVLIPTGVSLALLVLHTTCSTIKALDEEAYLTGVHGESYTQFLARTGRFLPRLLGPGA